MARSHRLKALVDSIWSRTHLPEVPLVVALSGGADSAALAWLIHGRSRPARAIHVHHGWPASDLMEAAARAVAGRFDQAIEVVRVDVAAGPSPEAMARAARYAALERALRSDELALVAHTLDDQAETVVANLLRGAGVDGLTGMPTSRGRIVRPLLEIRRDELRELAVLVDLPFRDDPANLDLSLRRNFIRHRILALLERSVAPGVSAALARMGRIIGDEVAFLETEAERRSGGRLACPVLVNMPVALERRVIRQQLAAREGLAGLRFQDVEAIRNIARDGGSVTVPAGIVVSRVGSQLVLSAAAGEVEPPNLTWNWLGERRWAEGWTFFGHATDAVPNHFSLSAWSEVFDADEVPETIEVRTLEPGDTVRLRGGTKPAMASLVEHGVPAPERRRWPVFAAGSDVIWIPGVRRSFSGWVGWGTQRYLCVGAIREDV